MRIGQPEPKRGNATLLVALIALSLVFLTLYYREGTTGVLHSARRAALAVSAPIATVGNAITSPVRAVGSFFQGVTVSQERLAALEAQNDELRARLAELEEATTVEQGLNLVPLEPPAVQIAAWR